MNLTETNLVPISNRVCPLDRSCITDKESTKNSAFSVQDWCGREISVVGNGLSIAAHSVLQAVQTVFGSINHLFADTPTAASIFRKLDAHVLRFFEHLSNAKGKLSQFAEFIRHNVAFIDFVQLVADIDYFAAGRFKEKRDENGKIEKLRDNNVVITGRLAFFVADIGGSLLWLQEIGFISLSKAASAIGEVRLFSFIPKVISSIPGLRNFSGLQNVANIIGNLRVFSFVNNFNCLSVTLRAIDLGYILFAADAGKRLFNADNKYKTISAGLDLATYLSELLLSAIVFAGVTNVIGLGVVGAACVTLVVSSFLYRITHEDKLRPTILQLPVSQ